MLALLILALVPHDPPRHVAVWEHNVVLNPADNSLCLEQTILWSVEDHGKGEELHVATWQRSEQSIGPQLQGGRWYGRVHGRPVVADCFHSIRSYYDREMLERDRLPVHQRSWK